MIRSRLIASEIHKGGSKLTRIGEGSGIGSEGLKLGKVSVSAANRTRETRRLLDCLEMPPPPAARALANEGSVLPHLWATASIRPLSRSPVLRVQQKNKLARLLNAGYSALGGLLFDWDSYGLRGAVATLHRSSEREHREQGRSPVFAVRRAG